MWVTLQEIEATCTNAARNAGYAGSLAASAGRTARDLAKLGLPFLQPLYSGVMTQMHQLESFQSSLRSGCSFRPQVPDNGLGPMSVAAALDDGSLALHGQSDEFSLRSLAAPVYTLPALARLSKRQARPILVRWPGVAFECHGGILHSAGVNLEESNITRADWVVVTSCHEHASTSALGFSIVNQGAHVSETSWGQMLALANRSYRPEADSSRTRSRATGQTELD